MESNKNPIHNEELFLIIAALAQFFFFNKLVNDEIDLYDWSLVSIIWSISAFYIFWIILREIIF